MPTMLNHRRAPGSGNHHQTLRELKLALEELGVTFSTFDRAFELADYSRALMRRRSEHAERGARVREVGKRLGRQELTPDKALKAAAEIDVQTNRSSAWHDILAEAAEMAMREAFYVLRDPEEQLITVTLQPMAMQLLGEIRRLRRVIPREAGDAAGASRIGEKVAAAWSRYEALLERWDKIHLVVERLRREGVLPTAAGVLDLRPGLQPYRWRHLLARSDFLYPASLLGSRPALRVLLDEVCDGWEPGVFTAIEVEENIKKARRQARAEGAGGGSDRVPAPTMVDEDLAASVVGLEEP